MLSIKIIKCYLLLIDVCVALDLNQSAESYEQSQKNGFDWLNINVKQFLDFDFLKI